MKGLKEKFVNEIAPSLQKELAVKNVNAVPKVTKVSVNIGIGKMASSEGVKDFSAVIANIEAITGQKPVMRKSTTSISNFKLKIGMPVGLLVTLRGKRMYDFIDRLVNVALPRVRDFRGISGRAFDGQGNYSIGLKDCTIFPEINPENLQKPHGVQINICTTAKNADEGYKLLKALGFPLTVQKAAANPKK